MKDLTVYGTPTINMPDLRSKNNNIKYRNRNRIRTIVGISLRGAGGTSSLKKNAESNFKFMLPVRESYGNARNLGNVLFWRFNPYLNSYDVFAELNQNATKSKMSGCLFMI